MSPAAGSSRNDPGYFPAAIRLVDKDVLVVGGNKVALGEMRRLIEFGARVAIVAPHLISDIKELAVTHGHRVVIHNRAFSLKDEDDISDHKYALVFACSGNADQDEYVAKIANQFDVLVCLSESSRLDGPSTFIVPAIRKRGHIKISVSTDALSHALARGLLERIDASVGSKIEKYSLFLDALSEKFESLAGQMGGPGTAEYQDLLKRLSQSEEIVLALHRENFEEAIQLMEMIISESRQPASL